MKKTMIISLFWLLALGPVPLSLADDDAVARMAEIMSRLNHYPTADDKAVLGTIADDPASSAGEQAIARAIMNLQHVAGAEDKAKLDAVGADESESAGARALAAIVRNIAHKPSDADRQVLAGLMGDD